MTKPNTTKPNTTKPTVATIENIAPVAAVSPRDREFILGGSEGYLAASEAAAAREAGRKAGKKQAISEMRRHLPDADAPAHVWEAWARKVQAGS